MTRGRNITEDGRKKVKKCPKLELDILYQNPIPLPRKNGGSIIKVGVTNRAYKNKNKKAEHI